MMNRKYGSLYSRIRPFLMVAFLLLLLSLSYTYAMFQGGFVSWFLFFSFLPFAIYSLFLFGYRIQTFQAERMINSQVYHDGDNVNVTIIIKRVIPFPLLFLIVEELLPDSLEGKQKKLLFPGMRRKIIVTYNMKVPRGEHVLTGFRIVTGDILGFIEKEAFLPARQTILVYPRFEDILYRQLESRYEHGNTARALQFQKDTSLVAGVRQYQPGDRFSWIDWKATARTNQMMAKEFEIRQTHDLIIVLDQNRSEHFEEAIKFSASLTKAILQYGGQVGFFSAGKERTLLPIRGGEMQLQQILIHLAKVKADSEVPLAKVLMDDVTLYSQPATKIIVTSFLDRKLIEAVSAKMRNKGGVIIFNIKKDHTPATNEELQCNLMAVQRGISVKTLHENQFRTALSEVKQA